MEKEESSIKNQKQTSEEVEEKENGNKEQSLSPEEKIKDLEDKLSRALAEMENLYLVP